MPVVPGTSLGPYEIDRLLGAGSTGEVYRARDTTLHRDVAIKLLLPALATSPERLARFRQEAQILASLNHPHVAQIHGLEDAGGTRALVMELVDGPTLSDRIARGAIPTDEALAIARQIALALEAAHGRGIIHRDLKPANIKVREDGTVKVLDFGLAKAVDASSSAPVDPVVSPPPDALATADNVMHGTPAYMSPEQARGRAVDTRTDLWAFGAVLYEMLTGRRAFDGDDVAATLANVLTKEPDWSALPADTPRPVRRLLRRCLEKDRKGRLDSAAGARLEIDDAIASPMAEALADTLPPAQRVAPVAIAALASGMAIAALAAWAFMRPTPVAPALPSRFAIVTPAGQPLNVSSSDRDLALSPDGRYLVYRSGRSTTGGGLLMVRAIDQLDARPIADVTFAYAPFFSPDSRWIGFVENAAIKKVPVDGGPVITLGLLTGEPRGASWGDDNAIVFATDDPATGLMRLSADGGVSTPLTKPDAAQHEEDHLFPSVLPGARGVLFTVAAAGRADSAQVAALDLKTGKHKTLVRGANQAEYVPASDSSEQAGYLIYTLAGALRAVRFDPIRLEVLGDPLTVVERMMTKPSGAANYAASRPGTIAYVPERAVEPTPITSLVWVDKKGIEEPIKAAPRAYGPPRLSPDGTRVAVGVTDEGNTEVWVLDLRRETPPRRLTFSPGMDGLPLWTPDGQRIVFMSSRTGVLNWYRQAADGTGAVERLTTSDTPQWPVSISPNASRLFGFGGGGKATAIIVAHAATPGSVQTLFDGSFPEISPDGRYLAYTSGESGREEIYVRPFPQVDRGRWQISTAGGTRAAWARNSRDLFYVDASMRLVRVPVRMSGTTFSAGSPSKVFDAVYVEPNPSRHYDVSPDGQRFLMLKDMTARDPNATPASMVVVEHWFDALTRRMPAIGK